MSKPAALELKMALTPVVSAPIYLTLPPKWPELFLYLNPAVPVRLSVGSVETTVIVECYARTGHAAYSLLSEIEEHILEDRVAFPPSVGYWELKSAPYQYDDEEKLPSYRRWQFSITLTQFA